MQGPRNNPAKAQTTDVHDIDFRESPSEKAIFDRDDVKKLGSLVSQNPTLLSCVKELLFFITKKPMRFLKRYTSGQKFLDRFRIKGVSDHLLIEVYESFASLTIDTKLPFSRARSAVFERIVYDIGRADINPNEKIYFGAELKVNERSPCDNRVDVATYDENVPKIRFIECKLSLWHYWKYRASAETARVKKQLDKFNNLLPRELKTVGVKYEEGNLLIFLATLDSRCKLEEYWSVFSDEFAKFTAISSDSIFDIYKIAESGNGVVQ